MESTRRSFIKNSTLAVSAAMILPANIFATGPSYDKPVLQLYSVDKEMHHDAIATLAAIQKIGYKYVEHAGYAEGKFYGYSPVQFGRIIRDSGLILLSGHSVLLNKHWNPLKKNFTTAWHKTIEDSVNAGQSYLITPWLEPALRTNESELMKFTGVLNKSGELCAKAGIRFGYHNHEFEFTNFIRGKSVYDIILQYTDGKFVAQQLDIGNILPGSVSISSVLKQYPGRFEMIHLKDMIAVEHRYCNYKCTLIGSGTTNIQEIIIAARKTAGVTYFVVDHDPQAADESLDFVSKNFMALKRVATFC